MGHGDKSKRKGLADHYAGAAVVGFHSARETKLLDDTDVPDLPQGVLQQTKISPQPLARQDEQKLTMLRNRYIDQLREARPGWTSRKVYSAAMSATLEDQREAMSQGVDLLAYRRPEGWLLRSQSSPGTGSVDQSSSMQITPSAGSGSPTSTGVVTSQPGANSTSMSTSTAEEPRGEEELCVAFNIGSGCASDMLDSGDEDLSEPPIALAADDPPDNDLFALRVADFVDFFSTYNKLLRYDGIKRIVHGQDHIVDPQTALWLASHRGASRDEPTWKVFVCPRDHCQVRGYSWKEVNPSLHHHSSSKATSTAAASYTTEATASSSAIFPSLVPRTLTGTASAGEIPPGS